MDEKEDGEISDGNGDSFDLAYKPVVRPNANASQYRSVARQMGSSDEDYSSDSDSDINAIKKKKPNVSKMETAVSESGAQNGWPPEAAEAMKAFLKPRRRNNVWSTVMQEQVLSQEIGGFGLKRRLDQGDRSVESYDFRAAHKLREKDQDSEEEDEADEEGQIADEAEEDEEMKKKRYHRKRNMRRRLAYVNELDLDDDQPRDLRDLNVTDDMTDEDLGIAMADALCERKPEIIVRSVETLGREKCLSLYKETQSIEKKGGLMILNGSRRRTPGGVFLQLLRKLPGIEKADMNKIFVQEEWRKRKRAHRKRERHESKPQGENGTEEGLHLGGLFSDDPGGAKCPGSTPVTSPQPSDNEEDLHSSAAMNQLSDHLPTPPPSVVDPRALKPEVLEPLSTEVKIGSPNLIALPADPRAVKVQSYDDDDFLLLDSPADAMDLF